MVRFAYLCCALLLATPAIAQQTERYVSDEISITLRAAAGGEGAATVGSLASGARVELIEASGGYAHVRTADGRDGWVPERYLKSTPPARERVQRAEKQLAEAQKELADLKAKMQGTQEERDKLMQDMSRIAATGGTPVPPELVQEAEQLRARVQQLEQEHAQATAAKSGEQARDEQRTMLLGGGLVLAGMLVAWLLLSLLPKRRW